MFHSLDFSGIIERVRQHRLLDDTRGNTFAILHVEAEYDVARQGTRRHYPLFPMLMYNKQVLLDCVIV